MTLLERQVAILRDLTERIVIVGGTPGDKTPSGLPRVPDQYPGAGPLGAIYTALMAAAPGPVLVVACDMPFLTSALLGYLIRAGGDYDAVVPRAADGYHPLCAVYAPSAATPIRRQIEQGALKVVEALAQLRVREIGQEELTPYDPDGTAFFNINTPRDYTRALAMASRR